MAVSETNFNIKNSLVRLPVNIIKQHVAHPTDKLT